jgi:hypothetical protein
MKETLDFSLFSSALPTLLNFPFNCFQFASLIRINETVNTLLNLQEPHGYCRRYESPPPLGCCHCHTQLQALTSCWDTVATRACRRSQTRNLRYSRIQCGNERMVYVLHVIFSIPLLLRLSYNMSLPLETRMAIPKEQAYINCMHTWSRLVPEKLTVTQLVTKLPFFYETRRFALLARARHWNWSELNSAHPVSL